MDFDIIGAIGEVEVIAVNLSIRELAGLKEKYGGKRWRKLKGAAQVRLSQWEHPPRRDSRYFLRVVGESGEDYLYPAARFVVVDLDPKATKRILAAPVGAS